MPETDESEAPETTSRVGERLRAAREEQDLTLEDIASKTRIPRRHLEAIENGDWASLPAPTYTIGFAKSYASAIGLDRNEIGDDIRTELGGSRPVMAEPEVFEPIDPARTMPKWLVITAIAAIVLVVLVMTWLNSRSLDDADPAPEIAVAEQAPGGSAPAAAQPQQPAVPQGPVVLTASEPVWLQVYERSGRTLFQGELATGQRYQVPANATEPLLRTGKPEALRVTVGDQPAPPIGPPARTVSDVSLLGADLSGGGVGVATAPPQGQTPR